MIPRVGRLPRRTTSAALPDCALRLVAIGIVALLLCSVEVSGRAATEPTPFAAALRTPGPPPKLHAVLPAAGPAHPASSSEMDAEVSLPEDAPASSVAVSTSTTWRPGTIRTATTRTPAPNATQLLTLVYSSQLINDSAYAIGVWCATHGTPALVTHQIKDTLVTPSYGLWGPTCSLENTTNTTAVNITYYNSINISFYRSYLSVTTSADTLEELIDGAKAGILPGILCIDDWSTKNMRKEWTWIAGVVVAAVASVGALVLIAVQLVYKRGYVNATGPHLQNTGTYQDLEQAWVSFEAKLGSHSSGTSMSSIPPAAHMPPPLPLREVQQLP